MNRIFSLLAVFVLLALAACSTEKPPDPAAIETKSALTELRDMRRAYERKDHGAFMVEVADAYPGRGEFSSSIEALFKKYETVKFNIQYTKMVITIEEKGMVRMTFNWDGEWQAPGGNQKDGGRVTMVFESTGFKLMSIEGKNPFLPLPPEVRENK